MSATLKNCRKFRYTVIRPWAVRTSLDKKLYAEQFRLLSDREIRHFYTRTRVYAYLWIDVMDVMNSLKFDWKEWISLLSCKPTLIAVNPVLFLLQWDQRYFFLVESTMVVLACWSCAYAASYIFDLIAYIVGPSVIFCWCAIITLMIHLQSGVTHQFNDLDGWNIEGYCSNNVTTSAWWG